MILPEQTVLSAYKKFGLSSNNPWEGTPFEKYYQTGAKQKGALGELIVASFLEKEGMNVEKPKNQGHDRIINGWRTEIKFSCASKRNQNFLFTFNHISFCKGWERIIFPKHDLVLTSPPYYNLEIYSREKTQSENQFKTYEEWLEKWLLPLARESAVGAKTLCWNVANVGKMKLQDDLFSALKNSGWKQDVIFGIGSSARQANQNAEKNKKSFDITACFTLDKK